MLVLAHNIFFVIIAMILNFTNQNELNIHIFTMLNISNSIYIVIEVCGKLSDFSCKHSCLNYLKGASTKERALTNKLLQVVAKYIEVDEDYSGDEEDFELCVTNTRAPEIERAKLLATWSLEEQLVRREEILNFFDEAKLTKGIKSPYSNPIPLRTTHTH